MSEDNQIKIKLIIDELKSILSDSLLRDDLDPGISLKVFSAAQELCEVYSRTDPAPRRTPQEVDALLAKYPAEWRRWCWALGGCGCVGCVPGPINHRLGEARITAAEFFDWQDECHRKQPQLLALDAAPELLDALRWRRAGEELPEPGVDVVIVRSGIPYFEFLAAELVPTPQGMSWVWSGGSDNAQDGDLWIPIPPLPEKQP